VERYALDEAVLFEEGTEIHLSPFAFAELMIVGTRTDSDRFRFVTWNRVASEDGLPGAPAGKSYSSRRL
jgi:hypothetical protein